MVLTGSTDKTARLWDVKTGQPLMVLEGHTKPVIKVVFSPDGATLFTGSEDGTVRRWSNSGKPLEQRKKSAEELYTKKLYPVLGR